MIGTGIFDTRYKYLHSEYVATGKTGGGVLFFFHFFFQIVKEVIFDSFISTKCDRRD